MWGGILLIVVVIVAAVYAFKGAKAGKQEEEISAEPVRVQEASVPLTFTLSVEGMTCESCAVSVEQAVAKVPGVLSAKANFQNGSVLIVYDSTTIALEDLKKQCAARIQKIGYKVPPS